MEAAAVRAIRRRRLKSGEAHADVAKVIVDAKGLQVLVALGKYDASHRAGDVFKALNNHGPRYADAFRALKEGAHGDLSAYHHTLRDLIKDTQALCDWVQA